MDAEMLQVLGVVQAHFTPMGGSALGPNSPELATVWPTVERLIRMDYLETIPVEEVPGGRMVSGLTHRGTRALGGD